MMRSPTGQAPHAPPFVFASFAAAAVGLAMDAVTVPARVVLRWWA
ncbi:MAG: hypothetical protein ACTMIR_09060 [Cellulomonadaceae bacterium]